MVVTVVLECAKDLRHFEPCVTLSLVTRRVTTYLPLFFAMVRSTIIARASDALPLAASSDDEEVCTCFTSPIRSATDKSDVEPAVSRLNKHCTSTSNRRSSSSGE